MEDTLFLVKPHAVARGLSGAIIARIENTGLKIAKMRFCEEDAVFWDRFYPSEESWFVNAGSKTLQDYETRGIDPREQFGSNDPSVIGRQVKGWLVEHMSSSGSVAIAWRGSDAIAKVRTAVGKTLPNLAAPGTFRFDYATDVPFLANQEKRPVYNLVHASDPEEVRDGLQAAQFEIALMFGKK